jgi:hypothetical protein
VSLTAKRSNGLPPTKQALIQEHDDGWPRCRGAARTRRRAVYQSWMSERAQTYRKLQELEDLAGTAVTVQAMVFAIAGFRREQALRFRATLNWLRTAHDRSGVGRAGRGRRIRPADAGTVKPPSPARCSSLAAELGDILQRLERSSRCSGRRILSRTANVDPANPGGQADPARRSQDRDRPRTQKLITQKGRLQAHSGCGPCVSG